MAASKQVPPLFSGHWIDVIPGIKDVIASGPISEERFRNMVWNSAVNTGGGARVAYCRGTSFNSPSTAFTDGPMKGMIIVKTENKGIPIVSTVPERMMSPDKRGKRPTINNTSLMFDMSVRPHPECEHMGRVLEAIYRAAEEDLLPGESGTKLESTVFQKLLRQQWQAHQGSCNGRIRASFSPDARQHPGRLPRELGPCQGHLLLCWRVRSRAQVPRRVRCRDHVERQARDDPSRSRSQRGDQDLPSELSPKEGEGFADLLERAYNITPLLDESGNKVYCLRTKRPVFRFLSTVDLPRSTYFDVIPSFSVRGFYLGGKASTTIQQIDTLVYYHDPAGVTRAPEIGGVVMTEANKIDPSLLALMADESTPAQPIVVRAEMRPRDEDASAEAAASEADGAADSSPKRNKQDEIAEAETALMGDFDDAFEAAMEDGE